MSSQAHKSWPTLPTGQPFNWLGKQLLLVPEAVLLLVVLLFHVLLGGSLLTALLGLALVLYLVLRLSLLGMARQAVTTACYARAEQVLAWLLRLYPYSADAYALQGATLLARGQSEAAIMAFQRAIALFPAHPELHATLSAALLDTGLFHEARLAATQALELDPRSASAYLQLAGIEEQLGKPVATIEMLLRSGLAVHPAPPDEAALRCALIGLLLNQQRSQEARQMLTMIEPLLPDCPAPQRADIHFYLGTLLNALDAPEQARLHFEQSTQIDPRGRHAADAWRAGRQ